jgi:hypothetical protein
MRRAALVMPFDDGEALVGEAVRVVCESRGVPSFTFKLGTWFRSTQFSDPGLADAYLELLRTTLGEGDAKSVQTTRIEEWFGSRDELQQKLALLHVSRGRLDAASEAVDRLAVCQPGYPDVNGLRALIAASSGSLEAAYGYLSRTTIPGEERLHPWLAVEVHQALANRTVGDEKQVHAMCAALSRRGRLPSLDFGNVQRI